MKPHPRIVQCLSYCSLSKAVLLSSKLLTDTGTLIKLGSLSNVIVPHFYILGSYRLAISPLNYHCFLLSVDTGLLTAVSKFVSV